MTKERVSELDRLVSGAITDCEEFNDLVDGHILEFWRGAKMVVDELKTEAGIGDQQSTKRTGTVKQSSVNGRQRPSVFLRPS